MEKINQIIHLLHTGILKSRRSEVNMQKMKEFEILESKHTETKPAENQHSHQFQDTGNGQVMVILWHADWAGDGTVACRLGR
jgi:hypothetical protein